MSNIFTDEQIHEIIELINKTKHTQYIGSRYVPLIGRKGENKIEWDNKAPYEPLTIVLYKGNSYTSRQYTPIGIDILDTNYWANTGNYNAQIEQYRLEVQSTTATANNALSLAQKNEQDIASNDIAITDLQNNHYTKTECNDLFQQRENKGKFAVFGDSMNRFPIDNEWWRTFKQLSNMTEMVYARGGAGLTKSGDLNYSDQIIRAQNAAETVRNTVKYVFVNISVNDIDKSNITNQANTFATRLKSLYPNATIYFFNGLFFHNVSVYSNPSVGDNRVQNYRYIFNLTEEVYLNHGFAEINSTLWFYNASQLSSDGLHPNEYGAEILGQIVYNLVFNNTQPTNTPLYASRPVNASITKNTTKETLPPGIADNIDPTEFLNLFETYVMKQASYCIQPRNNTVTYTYNIEATISKETLKKFKSGASNGDNIYGVQIPIAIKPNTMQIKRDRSLLARPYSNIYLNDNPVLQTELLLDYMTDQRLTTPSMAKYYIYASALYSLDATYVRLSGEYKPLNIGANDTVKITYVGQITEEINPTFYAS